MIYDLPISPRRCRSLHQLTMHHCGGGKSSSSSTATTTNATYTDNSDNREDNRQDNRVITNTTSTTTSTDNSDNRQDNRQDNRVITNTTSTDNSDNRQDNRQDNRVITYNSADPEIAKAAAAAAQRAAEAAAETSRRAAADAASASAAAAKQAGDASAAASFSSSDTAKTAINSNERVVAGALSAAEQLTQKNTEMLDYALQFGDSIARGAVQSQTDALKTLATFGNTSLAQIGTTTRDAFAFASNTNTKALDAVELAYSRAAELVAESAEQDRAFAGEFVGRVFDIQKGADQQNTEKIVNAGTAVVLFLALAYAATKK